MEHEIYVFEAPRVILTHQGQNFLSNLVQQFEEMFKIKHVKTTAFHPKANGNIERMQLTLKNMIKTSMAENNNELGTWLNGKIIAC